ncbi:type III-B CRISPR module-associated Cmr3 family protein [Halomonas meridiana]|uniref:type III-B CRISPR module-associated Cmr3 family protein n=1 Tax=Vreelandella aquamarina TaxID=77097 RepID=UPI00273AAB21|nr:type III-B CRISPR module-associated Cmr3 family protein [Halomonas meridiana]MDP4559171.1 type III-B CRISPR module-associated Cmr3 family protein [Halomonas meridiana]
MTEQRCLEEVSCWRFQVVDSWFFRETRAHDAVGVSELNSVFPPPTRTLLGAIRTWLGDQEGVNWKTIADSKEHAWLGDADSLGQLSLAGVQLRAKDDQGRWQRLWPCPANLMQGTAPGTNAATLTRLVPGSIEYTDLGHVALPVADPAAPAPPAGSKVLEGAWLTDSGASDWLAGKVPSPDAIWTLSDLVTSEPRLGIARNNRHATVVKGQLYQTRHLRFVRDVSIDLWMKGVPAHLLNIATATPQTLRLGGEGRMAQVEVITDEPMTLPVPPQKASSRRVALWLTSPLPLAPCDAIGGLPGFRHENTETDDKRQDVWVGELNGISLTLTANCRPRAYREGGWDQQRHRPKAVRSYLPPGSVVFCECRDDTPWQQVVNALHGNLLGGEPDWGRGHCLVGLY